MKLLNITLIIGSIFLLASCKGNKESLIGQKYEVVSSLEETDFPKIKQLVNSKSATIIDVRTPEEFSEGHISNSINIPLNTVADSLDVFKKYENIVVVCGSGKRAAKAKAILNENGFNNVYNRMGWAELNELLK